MRGLVAVAGALLAIAIAAPAAAAAQKPFVYVVVIDGLDGDEVEAGTAPFISSLLAGDEENDATYYPDSASVMPAVTNANHAAMMTGAFSATSGVAGNAYAIYAPLEDEESCSSTGPFDFSVAPTPTTGQSPGCLRAETAFESILRQTSGPHPTTAAIFGKPKLGRLFAQPRPGGDGLAVDHLWAPCSDDVEGDEGYCAEVDTNPASGYALTDEIVMDEVVRTVEEGVMSRGKLRRPKLSLVNLPQVDSAGHAATPASPLYDEAIAFADDEVERLVGTLQSAGIWNRSVLVLLSDHSMASGAERVNTSPAFEAAGVPDSEYTYADSEENGSVELVYLNNRVDGSRHRTLKRMREAALGVSGVAEALYREPNPRDGGSGHTLERQHPGWHVISERTGDLFLTAEDGHAFSDPGPFDNRLPGHHGAPHTRDNFLAVAGAPDLVRQGEVSGDGRARNPVNVDVAPTLMKLFGLAPPADNRGHALGLAFDPGTLGG